MSNKKTTKRTNKTAKSARSCKGACGSKSSRNTSKMAKPNRFWCILLVVIMGVAALVAVSFITIYSAINTNDKNYALKSQTDAEKFASEYTQVGADNVFVYKSAQETIDILEHGTGVVFLGFPSCPWCQRYAKYLSEVAKEQGIDKIYYYNIYDARKDNTSEYQQIVSILMGLLQYDEEGQRRVYVPEVAFVVEGSIIGNDHETSKDTGGLKESNDYWTEEKVASLKSRLSIYMKQIAEKTGCTETCNS